MRGVSTVARRVSKQRDDLEHLEKGTGPSVSHDQRDGRRPPAALMDEMNAQTIDGAAIVVEDGQLVELSFPIELVSPIVAELSHKVEINAEFPARAGYFVGPAGPSQADAEIFNRGFGVGEVKWLDLHFFVTWIVF